jgi:phosphate transport system protein
MTIRYQFEHELESLKLELIKMGDQVIANIKDGMTSFLTLDTVLADKTIKSDKMINAAEQTIQKECLRIILREQPVAKDLRLIAAILKMITDLERIGDHAADISKMTIYMQKTQKPFPIVQFKPMIEASMAMIKKALDSFVKSDIKLAGEVIDDDDYVDGLFEQARQTIAAAIRNNVIDADYATYAMMIAKYLERISDHAVNIGEWVIFSITGEHKHNLIF